MLSGRLPFEAHDPQELARMHLNSEPPALHTLNPHVPLQLESIVRRVGELVAVHVIPNPHSDVEKVLPGAKKAAGSLG